MSHYLARLKNFEKGGEGHPKKPKELPKPNCLGFLGTLPPPFPKNEGLHAKHEKTVFLGSVDDAEPVKNYRLFTVTDADGKQYSVSRCPAATLVEIREDYPGCTVEAVSERNDAPALQPDDLQLAYALLRHWDEDDTATGTEWLEGLARDPERLAGMRAMAHALGVAVPVTLPPDDRRTCQQCRNLARNGRCMAAGRGELPMTARQYEPVTDRLERCIGYLPGADDPDQRPGRERYPHLAARAGR